LLLILLHILHHWAVLQKIAISMMIQPMKLTRRESTLYIRKRVPRRYRLIEEREYLWISLHTDSEAHAIQKAPVVWQEMIEAWEAKLAGATDDAAVRLAMAKELAAKRGLRFLHAPEVAKLPINELLDRIESVVTAKGNIDTNEADAVLGTISKPKLTVTKALAEYWKISEAKTIGKSVDQVRRWENPRKKAIAAFVAAVGDFEIRALTTADLMTFQKALAPASSGARSRRTAPTKT